LLHLFLSSCYVMLFTHNKKTNNFSYFRWLFFPYNTLNLLSHFTYFSLNNKKLRVLLTKQYLMLHSVWKWQVNTNNFCSTKAIVKKELKEYNLSKFYFQNICVYWNIVATFNHLGWMESSYLPFNSVVLQLLRLESFQVHYPLLVLLATTFAIGFLELPRLATFCSFFIYDFLCASRLTHFLFHYNIRAPSFQWECTLMVLTTYQLDSSIHSPSPLLMGSGKLFKVNFNHFMALYINQNLFLHNLWKQEL
jgi:hypothetical protein